MSEILAPFSLFRNVIGSTEDRTPYILGVLLGGGAFGKVWRVRCRQTKKQCVAKLIDLSEVRAHGSRAALMARSEVGCQSACKHFACVGLVEFFYSDNLTQLLIIMEYCDAGTLKEKLHEMRSSSASSGERQRVGFVEGQARQIFVQLTLAVNHLHRLNILHRDIKDENVLLSSDGLVKLGDFGLSRAYNAHTVDGLVASTGCGTPAYLAPEVWLGKMYGSRADVWSLGVLMYQVFTGSRPFLGEDTDLKEQILEKEIEFPPEVFECPELRSLLSLMLKKNPEERTTITDVIQHAYMRNAIDRFRRMIMMHRSDFEDRFDFILEGINEHAAVVNNRIANDSGNFPQTTASFVRSLEGPVQKIKDKSTEKRYLVLKDGFLGIFRDARSYGNVALTSENAQPVAAIAEVRHVLSTSATDNVFELQLYCGESCPHSVFFFSVVTPEECTNWVQALRSVIAIY